MPLPNANLGAKEFADDAYYFHAKLNADPKVAHEAPAALEVVKAVDAADRDEEAHERAEVGARAVRDWFEQTGDERVIVFRRELAGATGPRHETLAAVFPEGIREETEPRGESQLSSWRELARRIDLAGQAAAIERDASRDKIRRALAEGKESVLTAIRELEGPLAAWTAAKDAVAAARLRTAEAKTKGLADLGAVVGRLRGLLGSEERAYSYTKPAQRRRSAEPEAPAAPAPLPVQPPPA